MKVQYAITLFLIAASPYFSGASAANIYKCGNTYSQVPCPNAVEINPAPGPSAQRQREAQKAVQEEKRAAQAMEKSRRAEERAALQAQQAADKERQKTVQQAEKASAEPPKKKKEKDPGYFVAKSPASKASQPK